MWNAAQDPEKLDEIASDPVVYHLCEQLKLRLQDEPVRRLMEPCGIYHTVAILVNEEKLLWWAPRNHCSF